MPETLDRRALMTIGVATNDDCGNTTVLTWDTEGDKIVETTRNRPACDLQAEPLRHAVQRTAAL